ncbi:hypothetical protein MIR68_006172 [Amoeboaphelidium protococcarum]|nr:hypothetical protein MIR68_006172 [Amoeboaphelidium protococcarum]
MTKSHASLYRDTAILAPMVRTGSLPMRRLCLDYGADLVYSPEFIDRAVLNFERVVNDELGIIEYIDRDKRRRVFALDQSVEQGKLIFQMGTADKDLAVRAANMVIDDVTGIDINCGCPKHFSIHGGMGSALLKNPDNLCSILSALVEDVVHGRKSKPVTCKIRIVPPPQGQQNVKGEREEFSTYLQDRIQDTVKLVGRLQDTGICALAIHARLPSERYETDAHQEVFRRVKEALDIPVIANGDVFSQEDIKRVREDYGVDGVMIARAAQSNASVFRREGPLPVVEVAREYLQHSIRYHNAYQNTKFVLNAMMPQRKRMTAEQRELPLKLQRAKSMQDLMSALGVSQDQDALLNGSDRMHNAINDDLCPYIPRETYMPPQKGVE